MQAGNFPHSFELTAQFYILHEINLRISPHRQKNLTPNKDCLVTSRNARQPRAHIHEGLNHTKRPALGIKAHVKAPADHFWVDKSLRQYLGESARENRISMKEK